MLKERGSCSAKLNFFPYSNPKGLERRELAGSRVARVLTSTPTSSLYMFRVLEASSSPPAQSIVVLGFVASSSPPYLCFGL